MQTLKNNTSYFFVKLSLDTRWLMQEGIINGPEWHV